MTFHVMVDIETIDILPTAAILSIGAVRFNEKEIVDRFYCNVNPSSCVKRGLSVNRDTIQWWSEQSEAARETLKVNPLPIEEALAKFAEWYTSTPVETIWGNGAAFDPPILDYAFRKCELVVPWKYWQIRCFRTIRELFPLEKEISFEGAVHNALDDAIYQTQMLLCIAEENNLKF